MGKFFEWSIPQVHALKVEDFLSINQNNTMSKPLSLNAKDFAKGAVVIVIAAILGGLQQMVTAHGLDFPSYDWSLILQVACTAFLAYLSKNFLSDEDGRVMGRIG
jgi:hypothetical protein